MPRSTKRATETELNVLHRLTVNSLVAEMRRLKSAKQPVPPALLTASIKLLTVTGSTTPERPAKRADRLKGLLEDFENDADKYPGERAPDTRAAVDRGVPDFTLPEYRPARDFPDEG
jgi:hypothetical protein